MTGDLLAGAWVRLPVGLVVALDVLGWAVIQLSWAWAITRAPAEWFDPDGRWCRERGWERGGRLYRLLFGVHLWKRILPDGAALFRGGFRKKRLVSRDPAYLEQFRRETARGEIAHWIMLAHAPVFLVWNPPWASAVMVGFGVLSNLPPIVAQRYNRIRLAQAVAAAAARTAAKAAAAPLPFPERLEPCA